MSRSVPFTNFLASLCGAMMICLLVGSPVVALAPTPAAESPEAVPADPAAPTQVAPDEQDQDPADAGEQPADARAERPGDPPIDPDAADAPQPLGADQQPLPPPQDELGVRFRPAAEGLVIEQVAAGGLFARAGARPGDQVILVGDLRVGSQAEVARLIAESTRRQIPIAVLRNGQFETLTIVTGQQPQPIEAARPARPNGLQPPPAPGRDRAWLGIYLSPRTPQAAVVEAVHVGSAADQAGLEEGDRIVALNGQPIESAAHLAQLISQMQPGDQLQLDVIKQRRASINATLGERPPLRGRFRYEDADQATPPNGGPIQPGAAQPPPGPLQPGAQPPPEPGQFQPGADQFQPGAGQQPGAAH